MKIPCLIVDDEPLAREVLERYIGKCPHLDLVASAKNTREATEFIHTYTPKLIFLDINLPDLSGVQLARVLPKDISVIFTTAYPDYAVEGFELAAVDYLLKPISFERFLQSVNRLPDIEARQNTSIQGDQFVIIKEDKKLYKVPLEAILYVQGYGDYLKIFTPDRRYVFKETIKNFLGLLPSSSFVRIHKSFLCRFAAIDYIEGNQVFIAGESLPIGQTFKEDLLKRLGA